mgnify:CR=1 FL=1
MGDRESRVSWSWAAHSSRRSCFVPLAELLPQQGQNLVVGLRLLGELFLERRQLVLDAPEVFQDLVGVVEDLARGHLRGLRHAFEVFGGALHVSGARPNGGVHLFEKHSDVLDEVEELVQKGGKPTAEHKDRLQLVQLVQEFLDLRAR